MYYVIGLVNHAVAIPYRQRNRETRDQPNRLRSQDGLVGNRHGATADGATRDDGLRQRKELMRHGGGRSRRHVALSTMCNGGRLVVGEVG